MGLKTRIQGFGLSSIVIDEDKSILQSDNINEKPKPDFAPLSLKVLSSLELAFKESIHSKLLDILDLSVKQRGKMARESGKTELAPKI